MNLNRLDEAKYYGFAFFLNIIWMVIGPAIFFVLLSFTIYQGVDPTNLSDPDSLTAYMLAEFLSKFAPIILSIYIFRLSFKDGITKFKENYKKYLLIIVIGFIAIIVFNYIATLIYDLIGVTGTSENQTIIERALNLPIRPIIVITVLVFAPIIEEIIFRKFLIKFLKTKISSPLVPYILSAVMFAIIHLDGTVADLAFLPVYLILSSFITLGYKLSNDNIYVAMGIHFLNNLLSLVSI